MPVQIDRGAMIAEEERKKEKSGTDGMGDGVEAFNFAKLFKKK